MNVLFFGSTDGTACSLYYFTAMVRMGFNVLPYEPHYFRAEDPLEKFKIRLNKGPTDKKIQQVSKDLIQICKQNQFDVIFVMAENYLGQDTMDEIRKKAPSPPLFVYHSHDNNYSDGICKPKNFFETLASYDYVFTTKSQNVSRYQAQGQKNAFFIPSAFEPMVHRPIPPLESLYEDDLFDVVFIGTYDHSRDPYMDCAGWGRLEVWGSNWKKYPLYDQHRHHIHTYPIYYFEFADVISHCKCALGLLREEAEDLHTQRTFEIPACRGFQITPRNDEILSFFKEGKEIVCFETLAEFQEKIDYYLSHEKERKKIAEKGYQRCLSGRHTFLDRLNDIFQIMEGEQKKLVRA